MLLHFSSYLLSTSNLRDFFLSERKRKASTIFAGFPRLLFSAKRSRGKTEKCVKRERRGGSSDGPRRLREPGVFKPTEPSLLSLFFKDAGTNLGHWAQSTYAGPAPATNDGATVTGTLRIVSRESLITRTRSFTQHLSQVTRERQRERAAPRIIRLKRQKDPGKWLFWMDKGKGKLFQYAWEYFLRKREKMMVCFGWDMYGNVMKIKCSYVNVMINFTWTLRFISVFFRQ